MEEASELCFDVIEPLKQEEPRLCRHMSRWYPEKYDGRGKCHFRAAHSINSDAAKTLHQNRVAI